MDAELISHQFRLADMAGQIAAFRGGAAALTVDDGRLAAWLAASGSLNRILVLRRSGAVESAAPHALVGTSRTALQDIRPFTAPLDHAPFHELRIYSLYPGKADDFAARMAAILPVREAYSANVGTWRAASGDRDRVFHIWAYADAVERDAVRVEVGRNRQWQAYVEAITPLIAMMESIFLTPLPAGAGTKVPDRTRDDKADA